jgi:hypothetical protein
MTNASHRRSVLLFILTMALSQIMCNAPSPSKYFAVESPEEDVDLSELNSGIFEVSAFDVLTQQHAECPTTFNVPQGPGVSFETTDEGLFVISEGGKVYYPNTGPREYCRSSYEGTPPTERVTCLRDVSASGFTVDVRILSALEDDPDDDFVVLDCYQATHTLSNTLDALLEEASDLNDFDLSKCLPGEGDYQYETINVNERSNETKRVCSADGVITNTGATSLSATAYRVHFYGSFDYEKWVYSRRVEPGETVDLTEFYHCTGGVCGNGEWFYFTHLALVKDTPECQQHFRAEEEPPEELRISIPNPCEW